MDKVTKLKKKLQHLLKMRRTSPFPEAVDRSIESLKKAIEEEDGKTS